LRECMGAKQSCQEDFVLQLKWVSWGERTEIHKDE
jgi:hypothetical protein